MQNSSFAILIIYLIFSFAGFGQNLSLKIEGETEKHSGTIDSLGYLKTHSDYKSIKAEVGKTQQELQKQGYIEAQTKSIFKTSDTSFLAKLDLKRKFDTIYIHFNKTNFNTSWLKNISNSVFDSYFKLPFPQVENAMNHINNKIAAQGLPFSKVKLSNITVKNAPVLSAKLVVDTVQKTRTIDNIIIKGYEKFPEAYLKHFLKIKKSQIFDVSALKIKSEQLANLRFAKEIKPPEVLFSKDSTSLFLYIEKTTSNAFDGFLGFGTNEDTNKLEFDGYLNLNLTNNLHYGESLRLLYKSDENDQKTFQASATLPYLFKTPVGVDLELQIFKKDSTFTTAQQSANLHYQINPKHKIYTGITSSASNYLRSTSSSTIEDYQSNYLNIGHQFLHPQVFSVLFPLKSQLQFETGFGKRKTDVSSVNQFQIKLDAYHIFNLNRKNSIYVRTDGSYLISNNYFENELFRFGGINSIRGFEENSLFASLYGIINSEYRYQLSQSIYAHSIFDLGYFENKITRSQQKLFGFGFGFGILTQAGLFKFNYANGKNEDSNFKLANSKIHLSLIANF